MSFYSEFIYNITLSWVIKVLEYIMDHILLVSTLFCMD